MMPAVRRKAFQLFIHLFFFRERVLWWVGRVHDGTPHTRPLEYDVYFEKLIFSLKGYNAFWANEALVRPEFTFNLWASPSAPGHTGTAECGSSVRAGYT